MVATTLEKEYSWMERSATRALDVQDSFPSKSMSMSSMDDEEVEEWLQDASGMADDLARYGEDEIIVNALKVAGGDLWHTTRSLEEGLRREETEAVEEYVHESAGVAQLRLQIENCDGVLSIFEAMLSNCQDDLGNMAAGVRKMKERADAFEIFAKNRKAAETSVAEWVRTVAIPPGLAKAISEEDVGDPQYAQHLQVLTAKLAFVAKQTGPRGDMPVCCSNAAALLRKLRARAVERISAHLKSEMQKLEDENQMLYVLSLGQAGKASDKKDLVINALTLGLTKQKKALDQLNERQQQILSSIPLILFLIDNAEDGTKGGKGKGTTGASKGREIGDDGALETYQTVLNQYTKTMRAALSSQMRAEYRAYAATGVRDVITANHHLFPPIEHGKGVAEKMLSKTKALAVKSYSRSRTMTLGVSKSMLNAAKGELSELKNLNPSVWDWEAEPCEDDWCLHFRLDDMLAIASPHARGKGKEKKAVDELDRFPVQAPEVVLQRLLTSFVDLLDNESRVVCRLFPRRSGDELIGMFVPALEVIGEAAESLVASTNDPVSLLLMVLALERSQARVCDIMCCDAGTGDAFDDFYMSAFITVWPRFKLAVEEQMADVREGAASVDPGVMEVSSGDLAAFATRYAHLSAGLHLIAAQLHSNSAEMAQMSLKYMWEEVWEQLWALAKEPTGQEGEHGHVRDAKKGRGARDGNTGRRAGALHPPKDAKKGSILLLNHLHEILGVYYDLGVCANGCTAVRKQMEAEVAALAPLVVGERFNGLSRILESKALNVSEAAGALRAFKQHWKIDFVTASAFLASLLNSPDAARDVTKQCLVKYVLLYCRVCEALQQHPQAQREAETLEFVPEEIMVAELEKLTAQPP